MTTGKQKPSSADERELALIFGEWRTRNKLTYREVGQKVGLSDSFLTQFANLKVGITLNNAMKLFRLMDEFTGPMPSKPLINEADMPNKHGEDT